MDAVVDVRMAGELARLGGLAILNLEGVQTRYDDPDAILERIATAPDGEVQALLAEVYQQPIREDLIAARLDAIHAAGSKAAVVGHAGRRPSVRPVLRRARGRPVPGPEPGQQRPPPRDRLRPAVARGLHPLHAHPGRGRQHDQCRGRLRAHGAGRGGRLRRGRTGRGVHDPRGPGPGRARRSRPSATSSPPATRTCPRPAATCRSWPTAGCVVAASWPRPWPPAPTR